ncbi:hypothetical protein [Coralliovum pocilloporae]|uniref:hypothetical protein n=1 Tax=Coralliovum pocilloporae TaxID=3066369 RepID=UPI003306FF5A
MAEDFDHYYQKALAPLVKSAEDKVLRLRKSRGLLALVLAALWTATASAGILALRETQPLGVLIGLGVFAGFGALIIFGATRKSASTDYEREFAAQIAGQMIKRACGGVFIQDPAQTFIDYRSASDLGCVPLPGAGLLHYGMRCAFEGSAVRLASAKFSSRGKHSPDDRMSGPDHHEVYFEGLLVEVDLPRTAPEIIIRRQGDRIDQALRPSLPDGFETIPSGNPGFDSLYEAATRDRQGATAWVTKEFARKFMELHAQFNMEPGGLSAAFHGGVFFLSIYRRERNGEISTENLLSLLNPAPGRRFSYQDRATEAWREVRIPLTVAQVFNL